MADAVLNKGKITRKLIPYLGGLMLVIATIGFFLQSGDKAEPNKEAARKEKERLESLRAGPTEEEARKLLASQEEKLRRELASREPPVGAQPPLSSLPAPPKFDEQSLAAYRAAKGASAPASKDKMSMVAFEDFPGQKKTFAPQNPVGNGQANEGRQNNAADSAGKNKPASDDVNREWANKTESRVMAGVSEFLKPDVAAIKSVLLQGTIINAVTGTGLNTKLPGQIVASVSQDVYDSIRGQALLLPKGARLIGEYNTSTIDGQSRVMMAFTRLIYPSGASVRLGAMTAADALGVAGVEGELNSHFFKRLGSTLMLAMLAYTVKEPASVTVINAGGGGGGGATAAGNILTDAAEREINRSAHITPDITLAHGSKITLILAADLALPTSITSKIPTED